MKKISGWSRDADFRIKNRAWLMHSSQIARRILSAMDDAKMNKQQLALKVEVTTKYINKVVKGKENLTLEMISKFEKVLNIELISFPHYKLMDPIKID